MGCDRDQNHDASCIHVYAEGTNFRSSLVVEHSEFLNFSESSVYIQQDKITQVCSNVKCIDNIWNNSRGVSMHAYEMDTDDRKQDYEVDAETLDLSSYILKGNLMGNQFTLDDPNTIHIF